MCGVLTDVWFDLQVNELLEEKVQPFIQNIDNEVLSEPILLPKKQEKVSLSLTLSDSIYILYSDDVTSITCMLLSQKRRRWFFFWHGGITFICQDMFVSIILYTQHAASSTHVAFVCHGHHFAEETIVGDTRNTIYEKEFFLLSLDEQTTNSKNLHAPEPKLMLHLS